MLLLIKRKIIEWLMSWFAKRSYAQKLPNNVNHIALWQLGGVGDMLLVTPVIEAVNHKYPNAQIDVWCSHPHFAKFLERFPQVQIKSAFSVDDFDARTLWEKKNRAALKDLLAEMSVQPYDLLMNLHVPALLDWWAVEWWLLNIIKPRYALGFNPDFLIDESIFDVSMPAKQRKKMHYTKLYQALLEKADINCGIATQFPIRQAETDSVKRLLEKAKVDASSRLICLHIGGRRLKVENKMWSIDAFAQVAAHKIVDGFVPVLIGVTSEAEMGDALMKKVEGVVNLIGQTELGEMAALIAQADVFVGHDSGPFHIAVACGTAAVAICGRPDAEPEYLQYEQQHVAVLTADTPDDIDVNQVLEAIKQTEAQLG